MTTKYIRHGGFASHVNSENDLFFQEILKDTNKSVKILLTYFSKEIDRIPVNKDEDVDMFNRNKGAKVIKFEIAEEYKFIDQVENYDPTHSNNPCFHHKVLFREARIVTVVYL